MSKRLFLAFIKKLLKIQSPSGLTRGYKYEYDLLKAMSKEGKL